MVQSRILKSYQKVMDERVKSMMLRKSILSVVLTIAMLMPLAQAVTVKAAADTNEYSCAITPQVRQTGNRLSGLAGTTYASLLA